MYPLPDLADFARSHVLSHFHSPSEETLDGVAPAMDAHFVHQADDGSLLVIGVLFNEGEKTYPMLTAAIDADPDSADADANPVSGLALASAIPSGEFYTFQGSLTTPPCTGGLQWFVATKPQSVSAAQIKALKAVGASQGLENGNARPTQELNGRSVTLTSVPYSSSVPSDSSVPSNSAVRGMALGVTSFVIGAAMLI